MKHPLARDMTVQWGHRVDLWGDTIQIDRNLHCDYRYVCRAWLRVCAYPAARMMEGTFL